MHENLSHQGTIFANAFLERFTKSNPKKTIVFYLLLIFSFLYLSYLYAQINILETVGLFVFGLLAWTFMEYILHRYIFHIDEYFPILKRFHYIIHGVHHENPKDKERLFMPPVPGTIIASILFLFWYLFLTMNALAFMAGICTGYLLYSYIHYSVHTKPSPLLRKLWVHHAKHHYKYPDKAFGVSSPLWDIIFKTMPPKGKELIFRE